MDSMFLFNYGFTQFMYWIIDIINLLKNSRFNFSIKNSDSKEYWDIKNQLNAWKPKNESKIT